MPHTQRPKPRYLRRRAIIPARLEDTRDPNLPDLDNVQGDVYFMFPKRWERFLFFRITNPTYFREDLGKYAPRITSSTQTHKNIHDIDEKGGKHRDIVSSGIAFARAGLNELGIKQNLEDPHFDKGSQLLERDELGDKGVYDSVFSKNGNTHGIILVAARERDRCEKEMNEIKDIFNRSIEVVELFEGRVRENEREHFGWKDGISQPALEGISIPKPGQRLVKPGVIIMGYPGDPLYAKAARPEFTKDGAFMVFRKLEQNVLFLEDYTNTNWRSIPAEPENGLSLSEEQRKELFDARLVGRFKSGVPLALCPYIEDDAYLDPDQINNFDYTERDPGHGCPLAAHVRKTSPRQLQPIVSKEFLDASAMVRAGLPYGDEISAKEREEWEHLTEDQKENAKCERGLHFVCYQSSIDNGFYRQTTAFGNNDFFPLTSLAPKKIGQDPIIGGPQKVEDSKEQIDITQEGEVTLRVTNDQGDKYEITGVAQKVDTSATAFEQKYFVTSRGGEYYFVPGIRTVKEWAKAH